jgi:glycosidase
VEGYIQKVDNTNLHQRQGGDIEGIIQHLDYIADLGMTALWTTPLLDDNDTLYSYHHYSTTNFYKVDPRLGTNDDFVRLVEECHRHGLKYIMDIVPNHVNPRHWWHNDLPDSNWYNQWETFTRTNYKIVCATDPHASKADKDQLQKGWFDVNMADLNYNNKLLFDYVLQSYIYWAELTGLDGFRVDTYPYNDLNLASQMMAGIRREYPNMNLVGECWVKSIPEMAYFQTGNNNRDGFDSQLPSIMDFILKDWLEMAFVEGEAWDKGMIRFYNHFAQDFALPNPDLVMNMLDNHDMARYSNAVKDDVKLIKMGMAMLATVRGYPQYYYGDEILIEGKGGSYEDARHCFPGGWAHHEKNAFDPKQRTKEQKEVYNYLRSILQFRKTSEALCYGKMTHFLPDDGVYCFFRYTNNQKVMVVVNSNEKAKKLNLERFNEMDIVGHQARNVATGRMVNLKETHKFEGKTVTILEIR